MPLPLLRLLPAIEQQTEFAVAPEQRCRSTRSLASRGDTECAFDRVHLNGLRDALQLRRAEIARHEQAGCEPQRRVAHGDAAGRGKRIEPRRDVHGFAERERFRARVAAERAHHDGAGVDADARDDLGLARRAPALIDRRELGLDRERGADGALRVVFVRLGIPEVDEHAVAEILRDVALEALHGAGADALINRDQIAQIFGIDALAQLGRAHEIAEHRGELAPLARGGRGGLRGLAGDRLRARRRWRTGPGLPAALRAKARRGRKRGAAARASARQRGAAALAETRRRRVLVLAAGAVHGRAPLRTSRAPPAAPAVGGSLPGCKSAC